MVLISTSTAPTTYGLGGNGGVPSKNNVVWDITDADADEVIIQPEAEIVQVFGGNIQ